MKVIVPECSEDAVSDGLRRLTEAIHRSGKADGGAGGFLGGEFGYGANFENDTFMMHRYCWCEKEGECAWCTGCGAYESNGCRACREDRFRHTEACYQTELHARREKYDVESGYRALDEAVSGPLPGDRLMGSFGWEQSSPMPGVMCMIGNPREDEVMEKWRAAYDKRRQFEDSLYSELGKKYGVNPKYGAAIHCTCGADSARSEAQKTEGCDYLLGRGIFARFARRDGGEFHGPPNFWHKPSDSRVNWYKYIGRSMEMDLRSEWEAILLDCLTSLGAKAH